MTTSADITALRSDISQIRWLTAINLAISLATLAAVLAMAFQT